MCYDDQAKPPVPPGAVGTAHGEDIVLTASDGNRFAAYLAVPSQPSGANVLIYPDVRGLHQFYKALALRFAEVGITALALDYFGRTAGLTSRDESFEFMPHVQQMQVESFFLDVQAALDHLRQRIGAQAQIFVVGFCLGGGLTLRSGTNPAFGFTGLIPFYAGLSRPMAGRGTVLEEASRVAYPVLGLFGGADQGIPESDVRQLDETLDSTGVEHTIVIYPGAPHSFFDRRYAEFADASADAWQRILGFIAAHAQPVTG
ncbi:MAG: dienelactone hydrolase family protein [Anaerolineae bacterium]|nr:dienelactone hydrolase family protein [Anaerolineae bacterium]